MSTVATDRTLPHNLDAERAILGAALLHPQALDAVCDTLTAPEFYRAAHQRIYSTAIDLHARGVAVDFVTVKEALIRRGALDEVGGPAYLASLSEGVPRSTNVQAYARIVRDHAARRNVILLANRLLTEAYELDAAPGELVDQAERGLLEISAQAVPGDLVPASQMVSEIYPVLERLNSSKQAITGMPTGLTELDGYTRGFQKGDLIILAARPSMGKSSLAQQIGLHLAQANPVAFFSVEMSRQSQTFRAISMLSGVDGHHLQSGQIPMHAYAPVADALETFSARRFWVDESPAISALQVRSKARRFKAKEGALGLIIVDYLQLMTHPPAERQDLRVAATSRLLKQIARELDVPVLALCQLSRDVDRRSNKKPVLSDLRESGALEQDADLVLFLYRPDAQSNGVTTEQSPTQLIIAKQRNGPTAEIDLRWTGESYRFSEVG